MLPHVNGSDVILVAKTWRMRRLRPSANISGFTRAKSEGEEDHIPSGHLGLYNTRSINSERKYLFGTVHTPTEYYTHNQAESYIETVPDRNRETDSDG